jgi:hypothetical protein
MCVGYELYVHAFVLCPPSAVSAEAHWVSPLGPNWSNGTKKSIRAPERLWLGCTYSSSDCVSSQISNYAAATKLLAQCCSLLQDTAAMQTWNCSSCNNSDDSMSHKSCRIN